MISFEISINKPQPSFSISSNAAEKPFTSFVFFRGFQAPRSLVQTEVLELKCFESLFIVKKIPFLDNPFSLKITSKNSISNVFDTFKHFLNEFEFVANNQTKKLWSWLRRRFSMSASTSK